MAEASENKPHMIGSLLEPLASSKTLTAKPDPEKAKTLTVLLSRLAIHYYRPDFTEAHARLLVEDYVQDLAEFAICDVEAAIRDYRQQPTKGKAKYFPDSSQLRDLASANAKHREEMARPVRKPMHEGRPTGWYLRKRETWEPHWREDEIPQFYREHYGI